MAQKGTFGVNTYRKRTKRKIGRHKKRMNKDEKRSYKKYNRGGW
jgi:flagellar capping protein FliD